MNAVLLRAYTAALLAWDEIGPLGSDVSSPLLLRVSSDYVGSKCKLMIVGQETMGWGRAVPQGAEELMQAYATWRLAAGQRQTPFWRASHQVHRQLNPGARESSFLWSNLVKVDQAKRRPNREVEEAICRLALLPMEVTTTRPDVVLFFSGPSYDARLTSCFPNCELEPVWESVPVREVARVRHPELPLHSYRLYHPVYLQRSRRWWHLERICSHLSRFEENPP